MWAILHDANKNQARNSLEHNNVNYDNVSQCLADVSEQENTQSAAVDDANVSEQNSTNITPQNAMNLSDDDFDDITDDGQAKQTDSQPKNTPNTQGKTPVIDAFSIDLTNAAAEKKMDPVVGRQTEITRLQEILVRRKKNNPILIGEPGVGKSAIVEGLAQMIAEHKTSPVLFNKRLVALDTASLVAGTKYR